MTTLSAIKRYMESHPRVSLGDLVVALDTTPDAARAMLEIWRAKNRVRLVPESCGSCGKPALGGCNCPENALLGEIYEWAPAPPKDGRPS